MVQVIFKEFHVDLIVCRIIIVVKILGTNLFIDPHLVVQLCGVLIPGKGIIFIIKNHRTDVVVVIIRFPSLAFVSHKEAQKMQDKCPGGHQRNEKMTSVLLFFPKIFPEAEHPEDAADRKDHAVHGKTCLSRQKAQKEQNDQFLCPKTLRGQVPEQHRHSQDSCRRREGHLCRRPDPEDHTEQKKQRQCIYPRFWTLLLL